MGTGRHLHLWWHLPHETDHRKSGLRGKGEFEVDVAKRILSAGTDLCVPVGATIGLENNGHIPLRLLVAVSPPIGVEVCPVCGILIKEREL